MNDFLSNLRLRDERGYKHGISSMKAAVFSRTRSEPVNDSQTNDERITFKHLVST